MSLLTPKTIVIRTMPGKALVGPTIAISTDPVDDGCPKKRRRLTHLSPDEKMLRRKLKNRVAAQTARDRKKAQMSDLEIKIASLEADNKKLLNENKKLKCNSISLIEENSSLKERLGQISLNSESKECVRVSDPPRSAAPADPLPKEQIRALSQALLMHYAAFSLTLSLMFFLGYWSNYGAKNQSSSRKRKQMQPVRCISAHPEQARPMEQWWGRHQQNWNPSMN